MLVERTLFGLGVALLAALLHGLPVHAAEPKVPIPAAKVQTELLERVTSYWNARIARDEAVYAFYPPPDKRPANGRIGEGGAVRFESFAISDVTLDGDAAVVTLNIASHIEGKTPFPIPERLGRRTLRENWNRIDGIWYKQPAVPAMRAASEDLQRAFLRHRAAQAAAAAQETKETPKKVDAGASDGNSGSSSGPISVSGP